jgi:hypothetical protein
MLKTTPRLLVGDVFHPAGGFAVLAFVDGDVGEGSGRLGTTWRRTAARA